MVGDEKQYTSRVATSTKLLVLARIAQKYYHDRKVLTPCLKICRVLRFAQHAAF